MLNPVLFLAEGLYRKRVVHPHHLHSPVPGERQPRHREEEPGIPRFESSLRFNPAQSRPREKIDEQGAGHRRRDRREQQPRHQHPPHRSGPQRPAQDQSGERGLHQRPGPARGQPERLRRRQTGAHHRSPRWAAADPARRYSGGFTGAIQTEQKRGTQELEQRRADGGTGPRQRQLRSLTDSVLFLFCKCLTL